MLIEGGVAVDGRRRYLARVVHRLCMRAARLWPHLEDEMKHTLSRTLAMAIMLSMSTAAIGTAAATQTGAVTQAQTDELMDTYLRYQRIVFNAHVTGDPSRFPEVL